MSEKLTLLTLPGEIREQIWAQVLHADNNYDDDDDEAPEHWWSFDVRLYRTCKQIYAEAPVVFKRINTWVLVTTPWVEAPENAKRFAKTPVLCTGDAAEKFKIYCQMTCYVDSPVMRSPSAGHSFVVDARDVHGFCRMWYYFDISHDGLNGHLRLKMTLSGLEDDPERGLSKATQSRLLQPWGEVRNLHSLTIEGPHEDDVVEDLRKAMAKPYPTPADCLERCEAFKDAGNAAFKASKWGDALDRYVKAFEAIHIIVDGRRRHIWAEGYFYGTLPTGKWRGQYGGNIYMDFRIKLLANIMAVYLKMEEYDMVQFWGMRSIDMFRQGRPDDEPHPSFPIEMGKVYYRTALAARALNDMATAREMVKVAARWLPNDTQVQRDRNEWGNLQIG